MAYTYQPFPRMLYRGEDQRIVANHGEELAAFADGWHLGPTEPTVEPVDPPTVDTADTADPPVEFGTITPTDPSPENMDASVTAPVHRPRGRPRKIAI